eukprot:134087-Rhodomonas_salina.2
MENLPASNKLLRSSRERNRGPTTPSVKYLRETRPEVPGVLFGRLEQRLAGEAETGLACKDRTEHDGRHQDELKTVGGKNQSPLACSNGRVRGDRRWTVRLKVG